MLDLREKKLLGKASVDDLPKPIARQLRATNLQFVTKEKWLYLVGGYGSTLDGRGMESIGQALAVDMDALVSAVVGKKPLDAAFAKQNIYAGTHPALQITGGALTVLGQRFLLVFGHMFNGQYRADSTGFVQKYNEFVRVFEFSIDKGGGKLDVAYKGTEPRTNPLNPGVDGGATPESPYHRRDFTAVPVLAPDGAPRFAVFGGVFKGGRNEGFRHPIYITPTSVPGSPFGFQLVEDVVSDQLMSQYEGVTVPLYSDASKTMYTTFMGGISYYYWDSTAQILRHDLDAPTKKVDGMPFINSVSTLRVGGAGSGSFLHTAEQFPPKGAEPQCGGETAAYLGTNGAFIPADGVPMRSEVILLDAVDESKPIGYVVGGIAAVSPYPDPAKTCASATLYSVTLKRVPSTTATLRPPDDSSAIYETNGAHHPPYTGQCPVPDSARRPTASAGERQASPPTRAGPRTGRANGPCTACSTTTRRTPRRTPTRPGGSSRSRITRSRPGGRTTTPTTGPTRRRPTPTTPAP